MKGAGKDLEIQAIVWGQVCSACSDGAGHFPLGYHFCGHLGTFRKGDFILFDLSATLYKELARCHMVAGGL